MFFFRHQESRKKISQLWTLSPSHKEASGGLNPASSQGYLEVSSVPWIKSIEQRQPSNPDTKFHEILIGL